MLMDIVVAAQAMLKMKRRCWRVNGPTILTGLTAYSSQFFGRGHPEAFLAMVERLALEDS